MLKYRLIPVLFLKHGFLVRSEKFKIHQNLGNPVAQVERYNAWNVDELIYIDITPDESYDYQREDTNLKNPKSILEVIDIVSKKCFMPLTFGGKIRTLEDIRIRMARGADKITINTAALENPEFVKNAAAEFGSQAIVVSIDALRSEDGSLEVYSHLGTKATGRKPGEWAKEVESLGAGEIFINSIDRDGMANGYDIPLIKEVSSATSIPVIACGGIGQYKEFATGITEGEASALAAGNIFHFKEVSYLLAKKELKKMNLNVR
ncbi:MAG: imidazole glycerol phosphate synthase subunit HisF [Bdellovibrionales bacterium]|nr:imidazole glycerol phosphate synthase subunit HisF [Bdellovibrionales bacterium]